MIIKGLVIILLLCEQSFQNPLPPAHLDIKASNKDPTSIPHPLVITNPEEKKDISSFLNIWEHRFSTLSDTSFSAADQRSEGAPKIILAVTSPKMTNLIPQDAPHPLYSTFYEKLTDDFILDSLSTQTIDFNDPQLSSPEGVSIKTMGGKDLVFKKDQTTNKLTVNDVEIEKHETITGDTIVVITSDFLFNYYQDIQAAFDELVKAPPPGQPEPGFRAEIYEAVPLIPESLKDSQSGAVPSGLIRIWENRLSSLDNTQTPDLRQDEAVPKTVLAVTSSRMSNLIPQDVSHPLYSPSYTRLTDDFLLDSFSTQTIDFNDPQLTSPQGVTIKSMSGKDLLFRKDQHKDAFTVNSIDVENHQQLPDGTNIIIISDFLFNNYDKVQKAFQEIASRPGDPSRGPFGEIIAPYIPAPPRLSETFEEQGTHPIPPSVDTHRGNERSLSHALDSEDHPPSGPETGLPEIPASFSSAFENDKFLNIWKHRLSKLQESSIKIDTRVPVTILPVTYFKMINLIPQDAPHPLYSDQYSTLANNFILDSLSTEKIDFEDPNLTTPEGVVIKTLTGKDLVFTKDSHTGKFTVNGIDIESHKLLSDQKTAVVLNDFLFNYYEDTKTAFREMTQGPNDLNGDKRSSHGDARSLSETAQQTEAESPTVEFNIPQVPLDLEAEDGEASTASQLVFLWKNRLSDVEQTPGFARTATQPKTVLAVEPFKMTNLIPQDAAHPLYSPEYTDLTDRFILESLSTEDINFDDPKLLTPEGLIIKTMNGKDLTFKKDDSTGKIQVNGIEVLTHTKLNGNTNLIVTNDFLFNIYDDVQTAFHELQKTDTGSATWFGTPTVIPAVPKVLEGADVGIDASGLVDVWENRLTKFGTTSTGDSVSETPKTIVAVNSIKMTNLIPQDAPNPLYSREYEHLANGFILDSVSSQPIDINDPKLASENGISIRALSGRDLVFKKDESTNKLTINNIEVENNKTFEDGTSVFVISDFLFDHQSAVRSAFDALLKESSQQPRHGPF